MGSAGGNLAGANRGQPGQTARQTVCIKALDVSVMKGHVRSTSPDHRSVAGSHRGVHFSPTVCSLAETRNIPTRLVHTRALNQPTRDREPPRPPSPLRGALPARARAARRTRSRRLTRASPPPAALHRARRCVSPPRRAPRRDPPRGDVDAARFRDACATRGRSNATARGAPSERAPPPPRARLALARDRVASNRARPRRTPPPRAPRLTPPPPERVGPRGGASRH